jgi:hypothetical protein
MVGAVGHLEQGSWLLVGQAVAIDSIQRMRHQVWASREEVDGRV